MNLQKLALASATLAAAFSLAVGLPGLPALSLGWYGGDACDDAAAQNPGDPAGCRYGAAERDCADGVDNDSDEASDCLDSDCAAGCAADCAPTADAEDCALPGDEECDGLADLTDPDCAGDCAVAWWQVWLPACPDEACADWADNDRDGLVDCADDDCAGYYSCLPEDCGNGADDNGNGWFDCLDGSCAGDPACAGDAFERCGYGTGDEDGNGLSDCEDPACAGYWSCGEICDNNNLDDDGDSLADCADPDCAAAGACAGTCGAADGCDPTCPGFNPSLIDSCACDPAAPWCPPPAAPEVCYNGRDDDRDGAADCADAECVNTTFCRVFGPSCGDEYAENAGQDGACVAARADANCADRQDDDRDGWVDCADDDCAEAPSCADGCDGDQVCDPACPEYDPLDPRCDGGGEGEICGNGVDDDGNGNTDCEELVCAPWCDENGVPWCGDGKDNDGDGWVDESGAGEPPAECVVPLKESHCKNGEDDDKDSQTDCEDRDCDGQVVKIDQNPAAYGGEESGIMYVCDGGLAGGDPRPFSRHTPYCADEEDNDGDGAVDCLDSDCRFDGSPCEGEGGKPENCSDHIDNDGDGPIDCDDVDCMESPLDLCDVDEETDCFDGKDNDGNGLVDCDDPACFDFEDNRPGGVWLGEANYMECNKCGKFGGLECETNLRKWACYDDEDNDMDGKIDSDDSDCGEYMERKPEICYSGVDEDGDGLIDCADPSCQGDSECQEAGHCQDKIDNDNDSTIDCADSSCFFDSACG